MLALQTRVVLLRVLLCCGCLCAENESEVIASVECMLPLLIEKGGGWTHKQTLQLMILSAAPRSISKAPTDV